MCMDFSDRIRKAVMGSGKKQNELAELVGVTPAAVNNWLNRGAKDLRSDVLFSLARVTGKSARWLATGEGPEEFPMEGGEHIEARIIGTDVPVIDFASVGVVLTDKTASPAMMASDWIVCPVNHGPRAFAYRVEDDSMTAPGGPKTYPAGCYVYVDPDVTEPRHDRPILAKLQSGEILLANYMAQAGRVWLRLLNQAYPPITESFEVCGVVIGKWEEP